MNGTLYLHVCSRLKCNNTVCRPATVSFPSASRVKALLLLLLLLRFLPHCQQVPPLMKLQ